MDFLDPHTPIATCNADTCDNCSVGKDIHCHFTCKDLTHFLLIALPSFLIGGAGIYHTNGWMLVPWLVIVIGFFGFVEIRVMCSHCPHYAEAPRSLKCWANYGSPKIWTYRPGPMTLGEKSVFFAGLALVWGYPFYFLASGSQWVLFIAYLSSVAGFFTTLSVFLCSQCMNFACPLNSVENEVRSAFFERNPKVADAWDKGNDDRDTPVRQPGDYR